MGFLPFAAVVTVAISGCNGGMLGGPQPDGGGGAAGNSTVTGIGGAGNSAPMGLGGLAGSGTLTGTGGFNCGVINRSATKLPSDILVLLDRSASMNDDAAGNHCGGDCGASSKWAQVTSAINEVVSATASNVNWGLKLFADSDDTCGVGDGVAVPVGPGNAGRIAAAIAASTSASGGLRSGSQAPMGAAENAAATYLSALGDQNPKYILLATDGLPTCASGGTDPTASDSAGAIAAVDAALQLGIPTFVVGVGAPAGSPADATLGAMANAGGEPRVGTPSYYSGASAAELTSMLTTALEPASSCTFSLGSPPSSDTSNDYIDVFADGVRVPRDPTHASGWDFVDSTHSGITLYGAVCEGLYEGTVMTVSVAYRCLLLDSP